MVCVPLRPGVTRSAHAHVHSRAEEDTAISGRRSSAGQDPRRADGSRHSRHTSNSNSSSSSRRRNDGEISSQTGDSSCVWMKTSICNEEGLDRAVHPWRGGFSLNVWQQQVPWVFILQHCTSGLKVLTSMCYGPT